MKKVVVILDKLLLIAKDVTVWFRVLVLVITGFAGAILFSTTKTKTDVTCEAERGRLINFISEMGNDLSTVSIPDPLDYSVSMEGQGQLRHPTDSSWHQPGRLSSNYIYASFSDTLPRQTKVDKWRIKIDSLLRKHREDSLRKSTKN